jgi:hypothetical protein
MANVRPSRSGSTRFDTVQSGCLDFSPVSFTFKVTTVCLKPFLTSLSALCGRRDPTLNFYLALTDSQMKCRGVKRPGALLLILIFIDVFIRNRVPAKFGLEKPRRRTYEPNY